MRIAIATVQVPFIRGGAEFHAKGLKEALEYAGHEADIITMPFRFFPEDEVRRGINIWKEEDFECLNGYKPDIVVCLKFPCYYLRHPNKITWLIHQFREVYDLWDAGITCGSDVQRISLKEEITNLDSYYLSNCAKVYANSKNVANRLLKYNRVESVPLYHPPPLADHFYWAEPQPYIFYPSRLEALKRQDLLIKTMEYVKSPVVALIAGSGGQKQHFQRLIYDLGMEEKVRLIGPKYGQDLLAYYAHCLGVFYGPYDEDYGYISLEAMLAKKPIITCKDSGGPLEFVHDNLSGLIAEPEPKALAEAIDTLALQKSRAVEMGREGYNIYKKMNISWSNVVKKLTE